MWRPSASFRKRSRSLEAWRLDPTRTWGTHSRSWAGKAEALAKLNHPARDDTNKGQASAYDLAVVYAGLNDRDRALEWLEKAYMERSGGLLQIKGDLIFDPIRSDERFKSLLRSLGLPPS